MNQTGDRMRAEGTDLMKTGAAITGGCLGLIVVSMVLIFMITLLAVVLGF